MSSGVQVFTVPEAGDDDWSASRQDAEQPTRRQGGESLGAVMQSLRNDFDHLERSFDATTSYHRSAQKERAAAVAARREEERPPYFDNASSSLAASVSQRSPPRRTTTTDERTPPRWSASRISTATGTPTRLSSSRHPSVRSAARSPTRLFAAAPQATTPPRCVARSPAVHQQSFVSAVEPEPVQTPQWETGPTSTPSRTASALGAAPELQLLDTLLGTVQTLKAKVQAQEGRLNCLERDNAMLREEMRRVQDGRDEWREPAPAGRRAPPRRTSPGSLFVEELSHQLPLNDDQYQVLSSLMDRYFGPDGLHRRR
jgi:hypothetical protein